MPVAIVCVASGLAYGVLSLNSTGPIWVLFGGSGQEAPQFLSSLMTAMINIRRWRSPITMVALVLAAQQLGPRLIHSFMSDRHTQIALGLFVGTVVYLLVGLRSAYSDGKTVPNLSVTGGTLLVLICLITLLLFVHHLAHSIVADSVIERVGAQLDADIVRHCPEHNDKPHEDYDLGQDRTAVDLAKGGYVQAINYGAVARAAAAADAIVSFEVRAGHHAVTGVVAADVYPKHRATDELRQTIQSAVLVGAERTTVQDLEYSVRHPVEVALRALSPGINDVYTALAVINRLALSLRTMMQRAAPQACGRTRTAVYAWSRLCRPSPGSATPPSTRSARARAASRRY